MIGKSNGRHCSHVGIESRGKKAVDEKDPEAKIWIDWEESSERAQVLDYNRW